MCVSTHQQDETMIREVVLHKEWMFFFQKLSSNRPPRDGHIYADFEKSVNESHCQQNKHLNCEFLSPKPLINETLFFGEHNIKAASYSALLIL